MCRQVGGTQHHAAPSPGLSPHTHKTPPFATLSSLFPLYHRRPGAVDRLLDDALAVDAPEPDCGGSDSDSDSSDTDSDDGHSTASYARAVDGGPAEREIGRRSSRSHERLAGHPKTQGVTSLFTWAGDGGCLAPLGALLPELRVLHVALPPSQAGLLGPEPMEPPVLPLLRLSFVALPCGVGPGAPPFRLLRRLTISGLSGGGGGCGGAAWPPSVRIGDDALAAIAAGLPALEALELDGALAFTGAGLSALGVLSGLRALVLDHWMDALAPAHAQLLRAPALALPRGLTSLRATHVQLTAPGDGGRSPLEQDGPARAQPQAQPGLLRRWSAASSQPDAEPPAARLAAVFGGLVELDWAHCDHAAADRLLEAALPACVSLQRLYVSGPRSFRHTPPGQALGYGVAYGLEAGALFALPLAEWLSALLGRGGAATAAAAGGGPARWLRHLAALGALRDLHLDLPLAAPAQLRALVDALVARGPGSLHALALHGVAVSLVTRRAFVVRQLGRLAPLGIQSISVSFGRHTLAALPSWLRGFSGQQQQDAHGAHHHSAPHQGAGAAGGAAHALRPDPRDSRMLDALAAAFRAAPEVHFAMRRDSGVEESLHSQPWGLPVPAAAAAAAAQGGGENAPGPVGEGAEAPAAGGGWHGGGAGGENDEPHFRWPVRLLLHALAALIGPRAAMHVLADALAHSITAGHAVGGNADAAGPQQQQQQQQQQHYQQELWHLQEELLDAVLAHHADAAVELPDAVMGCSRAAAAFAAGAVAALWAWTAVAGAALHRVWGAVW